MLVEENRKGWSLEGTVIAALGPKSTNGTPTKHLSILQAQTTDPVFSYIIVESPSINIYSSTSFQSYQYTSIA